MMNKNDFTNEEWQFLEWMKRPTILNKKKAKKLIDELNETIDFLRQSKGGKNRLEKNLIYNQIENRQAQIKWAASFL